MTAETPEEAPDARRGGGGGNAAKAFLKSLVCGAIGNPEGKRGERKGEGKEGRVQEGSNTCPHDHVDITHPLRDPPKNREKGAHKSPAQLFLRNVQATPRRFAGVEHPLPKEADLFRLVRTHSQLVRDVSGAAHP